ncbi:MAG: phosphoglycerate kinase [Tepidisphaerales bacterium]
MARKTVADLQDVKNKRVLVRVDFNVPLEGDHITDDRRIVQAVPTIQALVDKGAKVILMSHLGRPKGGPDPKYSLKPCVKRLSQLLGRPVDFATDCIGLPAERAVNNLGPGDVLLLENLRFHPQEEKNDPNFAASIAKFGDAYVNDAFGTAHREHASTFGVPQLMAGKPRVIGFLIEKELKYLGDALNAPQRPFVAILGGAKVSDKIKVIERLLEKADTLLIGGAMAYTFFLAQGKSVGSSLVEPDKVELARDLLKKAGGKLKLPVDTVIADGIDSTATTVVEGNIPAGKAGFDIGPRTIELFCDEVSLAKTIIWNGPMGVFEKPQFANGTKAVAQAVADTTEETGAVSVIGGGDSAAAIEQLGLSDAVTHVSTGGGASLEFLEKGHFATLDILD